MPFVSLLYVDMKINVMHTFLSVIVHSVQFSDVETWLRHSLFILLLQGVQLLYV
jgi:hypothetical protein